MNERYDIEKIEEMDRRLIQIQRSTKTLFAFSGPLHNALRQRFKSYYAWHVWPYSRMIHWALFSAYVIVLAFFSASSLGYFDREERTQAATGINKMVNYQGKLTNASNFAVPDGNYNMKLSIYTAASGGTPAWTLCGTTGTPTATAVSVANGIFSLMLGSTSYDCTGGGTSNTLDIDFNADTYYLGVTVGTDDEMSPRLRLGAAPYAYNADKVDGYDLNQSVETTANPSFAGLNINSGTIYVVSSGSNVGIGTTVPAGKLEVQTGSTGNDMRITFKEDASNQQSILFTEIVDGGALTPFFSIQHDGSGANPGNLLKIRSDGGTGDGSIDTDIMTFAQAGNVGIGTTGPSYQLDVNSTSNNLLAVRGMADGSPSIDFYQTTTQKAYLQYVDTGDYFRIVDNSQVGIVQRSGNVGIGTTTPANKLDVEGAVAIGATYSGTSTAPTNGLIVEGNVGIGTTTPGAKLHVYGGTTRLFSGDNATQLELVRNGTFTIGISADATPNLLLQGGSVGIGVTAPTAKLQLAAGSATVSTAPLKFTSGTDLTVAEAGAMEYDGTNLHFTNSGLKRRNITTEQYIQSRGLNLVTNGSGLMLDNTNFSTFTYNQVETHGGAGSFLVNVATESRFSDELIPVDATKTYKLSGWAKSGETGGANYNAANRQYFGVTPYDIDGNIITPHHYSKYAGSTDTTLAAQLNPGDSTMTVTDATGWYEGATAMYRNFVWWPYTNAYGYSWPNYTYTRNNSNPSDSVGTWTENGIDGNVITLTSVWAGATLPAGTPIRNRASGGTYKYIAASNAIVPNDWTRYEGYIGGLDSDGSQITNLFPYGTAYVKLLFLINYHGAADNNVRWSDLSLSEVNDVSYKYLASATGNEVAYTFNYTTNKATSGNDTGLAINQTDTASPGTSLLINAQVAGVSKFNVSNTGLGYFAGNVGIGTTAPGAKLHLGAAANQAIKVNSSSDAAYFGAWSNMAFISANRDDSSGGINDANKAAASIRLYTADSDSYISFMTTTTNNADPTEQVRITKGGLVGIGTTAPANKLDVEGAVAIGATYSGTSAAPSNGLIVEGNVGIGTTAPATKLNVAGAITMTNTYDAGALAASSIRVDGAGSGGGQRILTVGADGATTGTLDFAQSATDGAPYRSVMFIDTSGSVGIGTSVPGTTLDVSGTGRFSSALAANGGITFDSAADTVGAHTLSGTLDANTNIITNIGNAGTGFVASTGALNLAGALTMAANANVTLSSGTGQYAQTYTGTTTDAATITANSLTSGKGLVITSSATAFTGNLLDLTLSGSNAANTGSLAMLTNSGTLSTNTTLYLKHYATGTGNLAFRVDDESGDTSPFVIAGDGNIGIGLTAPATKLHTVATTEQLRLGYDADNYLSVTVGATGGVTLNATGAGAAFTFSDAVTFSSTATYNGDITITKADPALILNTTTDTDTDFWLGVTEDAGGDDDDLFQIGDGTTPGTNPFLSIKTDGNVGIGMTSPGAKLDVSGAIKLSGTDNIILNGNYLSGDGGDEGILVDSSGLVGIGTAASSTANIAALKVWSAATAGEQFGLINSTYYDIADTSLKQGLRLNTNSRHTTGTLSSLIGNLSLVTASGDGGTTTDAAALWTRVDASTGSTITRSYGLLINNGTVSGTIGTQYGVYINDLTSGGSDYGLYIAGADSFAIYSAADTNYFGGSVGIGTTAPQSKLDVEGAVAIGATYSGTSAAPTNGLIVEGNVGIGTTAPGKKLHIVGGSAKISNGNYLYFGDSAEADGFHIRVSGNNALITQANNASLTLTTAGSGHIILSPGGNVGIGTTAPGYQLEVAGGTVAGAGAYVDTSSHSSLKENFTDIDVLDKIKELRVARWTYKPEYAKGDFSYHLYPTTDDFYAAFGLNRNEYVISPEDIAGVALKGVKELAFDIDKLFVTVKIVEEEAALRQSVIDDLRREADSNKLAMDDLIARLNSVEARVSQHETRIAALEAQVGRLAEDSGRVLGAFTSPSIKTEELLSNNSISIKSGNNGDIAITPDGTGKVKIGSGENAIIIDANGNITKAGTAVTNRSIETFKNLRLADNADIKDNAVCTGAKYEENNFTNQPDAPRVISVTAGVEASGILEIWGTIADGTTGVLETIELIAGQTVNTKNAYAKIDKIVMPEICKVGSLINVGLTDIIGLSNSLHGQNGVYKVTKNGADISIPTVDINAGTIDLTPLASGDEVTIWYKY